MNKEQTLEKKLFATALPDYRKILNSDFVQKILEGSLPEERFCRYLAQDAHYLAQEAVLLQELSQRCTCTIEHKTERDFFVAMSRDCIAIEQEMQATFGQTFDFTPATHAQGQFAAYLQFLHTQLSQSLAVAAFAYFPCYYLYARLGKDLCAQPKTENNKYQAYLDTYAGEPFKQFVEKFLAILQNHYQQALPAEQNILLKSFATACHFESLIFQTS